MQTSYFGYIKNKNLNNLISIAVGTPKWFVGDKAPELMPSWAMVKKGYGYEEYKIYLKNKGVNIKEVYEKYKDKIILCWEKSNISCHRSFVARLIKEELGIIVEEFTQPSKTIEILNKLKKEREEFEEVFQKEIKEGFYSKLFRNYEGVV